MRKKILLYLKKVFSLCKNIHRFTLKIAICMWLISIHIKVMFSLLKDAICLWWNFENRALDFISKYIWFIFLFLKSPICLWLNFENRTLKSGTFQSIFCTGNVLRNLNNYFRKIEMSVSILNINLWWNICCSSILKTPICLWLPSIHSKIICIVLPWRTPSVFNEICRIELRKWINFKL